MEGMAEDIQKKGGQDADDSSFGNADQNILPLFHQKLLDRNGEKRTLLSVYQRLRSLSQDDETSAIQEELVLISGQSGSDKAMLATALRPTVENDDGYFLTGRFQENCNTGPYSVFVSAFTEFAGILVAKSCEERNQVLCKAIEEALSVEERLVLLKMIPAIQKVVSIPDYERNECMQANQLQSGDGFPSSMAVKNRFRFLFCRFCRAVFAADRPLVLFLDNLHWANPESLQLIHALITSCNPNSVLLIGSYEEEQTVDRMTHLPKPFRRTLDKWEKRPRTEIIHIHVDNLTLEEIREVLTDVFGLPAEKSVMLAELLWEQTNGERSGATLFLQMLVDQGLLYCHDGPVKEWTWDIEKARSNRRLQTTISRRGLRGNSPVTVTRDLIESMPDFAQEVLKVAACLGESIDQLALVMILDDAEKVSESLVVAERAGVLEFQQRFGCYRFRDGNSEKAAYSLIPEEQHREFKLRIGRKLWTMSSERALEKNLFLVDNLLNEGKSVIDYQPEKYRLAQLNLKAADKAMGLSLFLDAEMYLTNGIELLGNDHWKHKYKLSLELFQTATEVAVVNANFERVEVLIKEVVDNARTFEDKTRSYLSLIVSLGQQDDLQEAERVSLRLLDELGEPFPERATKFHIVMDLLRTRRMLCRMSDEKLLGLPEMTDESKKTSMHVMNVLLPYTFLSMSPFVPLIAFRMVRVSLQYGLFPGSPYAFATYGMILCGALGDAKEGYRFGQLALSFLKRNEAHQAWLPRTYALVFSCIFHWCGSARDAIEPLRHAYDVAMKIGDVETAMASAVLVAFQSFYGSVSLEVVGKETEEVFEQLCDYRQENLVLAIRPLLQGVCNLTDNSVEAPQLLTGARFDMDAVLKEATETNNNTVIIFVLRLAMEIAYIFGDFALASKLLMQIGKLQKAPSPSLFGDAYYAYRCGLVAVAAMLESSTIEKDKMKIARGSLHQVAKWAKHAPTNFSHKASLLKAELASLNGNRFRAIGKYDKAIQGAIAEGFVQEAAISCERAASHLQRIRNEKLAKRYLSQAHSLYIEWGAKAKAAKIEGMTERTVGNYAVESA